MSRRVLFYVQHLLGVGHLMRASLLARAMVKEGLDVSVMLGGPPVPTIDFDGCGRIPLPMARAGDETFRTILDDTGAEITEAWKDQRLRLVLTAFESVNPDVVMIEQFPFGRRQFRFELLPLLEMARMRRPRPVIVSSVRDVLVQKTKPGRAEEMIMLAERWFDRLLVHGDPSVLPLEASFPAAAALADKIAYTGYVAGDDDLEHLASQRESGRDEVIVSAGGGAVGETLLRTAMAARPLSQAANRVWRFVTGVNLPDAAYDDLKWRTPDGVVIERWRPDFPVLLQNCVLSISQAGYNTIMDILRTRARAVVVPFSAENEDEQAFRAETLAKRGVLTVVDAGALSPEVLASAVDEALNRAPPNAGIDMSGATATARIIATTGRGVAGSRKGG